MSLCWLSWLPHHMYFCLKRIEMNAWPRNTKGGSITVLLTSFFDFFGISCMTTEMFCLYLQNRLIQTSQTGGQWYSDTSLVISSKVRGSRKYLPGLNTLLIADEKKFYNIGRRKLSGRQISIVIIPTDLGWIRRLIPVSQPSRRQQLPLPILPPVYQCLLLQGKNHRHYTIASNQER